MANTYADDLREIDRDDIRQWEREFEEFARRPLAERFRYCFIKTYKPVLDDGPGYRSWETMEEYRRWCEENLPEWLGYGRGDAPVCSIG